MSWFKIFVARLLQTDLSGILRQCFIRWIKSNYFNQIF